MVFYRKREKRTTNVYSINQSINHWTTWECADFETYLRTQSINQPLDNMEVRRLCSKTGCADFETYPRTQSINQPLNNMGVRRLWDMTSSSAVQYFKWDKTVVALPLSCSVWSRPAYSTWAPWFPHSRCPGTFSWDRSWSCHSPPSPACSPGGSAQTAASTERSSTAHLQKMSINPW